MIDCKIESFVYYEHHKDDYVLPHQHSYLEMVFYLSGNGEIFLNGEKYYFKKNTISIINPFDKHDEISRTASNVFIILFSIKNKIDWLNTFIDLDDVSGEKIANTLYKIKNEYAEQKPYYEDMVNAYFKRVIIEVLRFGKKRKNGKKNESEIKSIIERAKKFLKENYSQDIDYEMLVRSFGYSYDRFRHIFAQATGNTLAQYLLTIRFIQAKILLENSNHSIKEIALECGFNSSAHFVNFFTKKMGTSPIQYRKIVNSTNKNGIFNTDANGCNDMMNTKKVKIMLDTDLGGDCDDVGAIALLHVLSNKGEAEIVGITHTTTSKFGAACIDIVNNFYDRPIPIGVNKYDYYLEDLDKDRYTSKMANKFPSKYIDRSLAMEATAYFRKNLSNVEGKIKIVAIGQLNNLARLLRSKPDDESPLSGKELLESKVEEIVIMGGMFNNDNNRELYFENKLYNKEYNISCDIASSKYFIENCPVKITFVDFLIGYKVKTFGKLLEFNNIDNPITYAYKCYCNCPRESWDLIAVLYAVRGKGEIFDTSLEGVVHVSDEGVTTFNAETNGKHSYLINKIGDEELSNYIDEIIISDRI